MRQYYVYILASRSRRLYTGITNNIQFRVLQHRNGEVRHTARYRINRLVYVEIFDRPAEAIAREKQLKGWTRAKKIALVSSANPTWDDLAEGWFGPGAEADPSLR